MSILLLAQLLMGAANAAETVDRSKEYRKDQRPYHYYKSMATTWKVGTAAAIAGPPLAMIGYFTTTGSFNRDPAVDSGGETAGYYIGTAGVDLALIGPPIMLFSSLSAIPALKKTGLTSKPTMGIVGAGLYVVSVGLYAVTLSSFENDPASTEWKAYGTAGTVAWLGSAFFSGSQIANTHRAGRMQTGK